MKNVIIVMGVAGSGKTTVGQLLAKKLGWKFYDADDFHPASNLEKMRNTLALDDADRAPWLQRLAGLVRDEIDSKTSMVLACSALREIYRQEIAGTGGLSIQWIYLKGNFDLVQQRLTQRRDHLFPHALLQSQFDALEEPAEALVYDIQEPALFMVERIFNELKGMHQL